MPWYIYLAFKQLFPSGKVFSFFTVVSVLGVTLGVALLVIVQTVMNGFSHTLREKIIDASGHVVIVGPEILYDYDDLVAELEADSLIRWVTPIAQGVVMAQYRNRPSIPKVHAIDVAVEEELNYLGRFLHPPATVDDLYDDGVFLSTGLARDLGVTVGSRIEVYSPLLLEGLKRNELILPREVEVAGIFATDWHEIDQGTMITTLRLMQDLYGMEDGAHALSIRHIDGVDSFRLARSLEAGILAGLPLRAFSWEEQNASYLWILSLEKNVMLFLLLFIVVVASFSIANSLFINVIRKTREIGLLGSIGGRPWEVGMTFCVQGFFLGTTGTLLGMGCGVLILSFRNEIIGAFAAITQSQESLERYYGFTFVPAHYETMDFIIIGTMAVLISTLAGLLPALRAARLQPVEAFRHE